MARKNSNTGKIILIIILTIMVAASGTFLFFYSKYLNYLKPGSTNSNEVIFTIPEGLSGSEVISLLHDEGFIQDETATRIYMKLNKTPGFFAGDFTLRRNMSVPQILDVITHEANAIIEEVNITIIPGDWAKDAAAKIAKATGHDANKIMEKWNDLEYMKTLMEKYEVITDDILASEHCYLEGYLAPDTYRVYKTASIEQITEKILDHTQEIYDKYKSYKSVKKFSIHELYTLASIIQFEASDPVDMQKVAGVFYNRLNDGWTLGSSVTICYALYDKYKTWEDCETNPDINSKYNTYKYTGLPIGPICNPNEDAIYAALNPKTMKGYYYFMANVDTGKIYYAKTLAEHEENIRKHLHN